MAAFLRYLDFCYWPSQGGSTPYCLIILGACFNQKGHGTSGNWSLVFVMTCSPRALKMVFTVVGWLAAPLKEKSLLISQMWYLQTWPQVKGHRSRESVIQLRFFTWEGVVNGKSIWWKKKKYWEANVEVTVGRQAFSWTPQKYFTVQRNNILLWTKKKKD